jgi:hypothetical protein
MIIIFMYCCSFSLLGVQVMLDSYGINLVGVNGDDVSSEVTDFIDITHINEQSANATSTNVEDNRSFLTYNPITQAAALVYNLFLILTGTYIFNVLYYVLGIHPIWISGIVILYVFMLMRTIIGYLRGI